MLDKDTWCGRRAVTLAWHVVELTVEVCVL